MLLVGVSVGCVLEDLSEQQRVLHQSTARDVQEAPQVQFAAEGRLQAALEEVLHPRVLLLMVQQGFGRHLVTAVAVVGVKTRQLQRDRKRHFHERGSNPAPGACSSLTNYHFTS